MEQCARCSKKFALFAAFGEVPGGLKFNGALYCWECFELVARELDSGAPSKGDLLKGIGH